MSRTKQLKYVKKHCDWQLTSAHDWVGDKLGGTQYPPNHYKWHHRSKMAACRIRISQLHLCGGRKWRCIVEPNLSSRQIHAWRREVSAWFSTVYSSVIVTFRNITQQMSISEWRFCISKKYSCTEEKKSFKWSDRIVEWVVLSYEINDY